MNQRLLPLLCLPALLATMTVTSAQQAEPGEEWTNTTEMQMQGMSIPGQTSTSCVPAGSTEPPRGPNQDDSCQAYDVERSGTTTKWKMRCTGERAATGTGEITWQGRESYTGKMVMSMDGQTMTMKMSGTRTGKACDAGKIKRQIAETQAQSDRMVAQQCAEGARGMQVYMFDGSVPMQCEAKYKQEFCNRMSTEEGYDLLAVNTGGMPNTKLTALESAGKTCANDPQAIRQKLCGSALKGNSLTFVARHCPDEGAPIAQRECAGRTFTSPPAEQYREFCNTYAQHGLKATRDSATGSGDAVPAGPAQPGEPPKEGTVEKSKKALKKLLPF